jgi:hypothetical protein
MRCESDKVMAMLGELIRAIRTEAGEGCTMPATIKHQGLSLCDYHYDLAVAIKRAAASKEKI